MSYFGLEPSGLQEMARLLEEEAETLAAARREVAEALASVGWASTATGELAAIESWLEETAADARRRADAVTRTGHDPVADFALPAFRGGGCGSVVVPVQARRVGADGRDTALGEPFGAAAPLQCRPLLGSVEDDDRWLRLVLGPYGTWLLAKGRRRRGDGGGGSPPPTTESRLKKAKLPMEGEFQFDVGKRYRPEEPIPWVKEGRGFKDAKGNVWRKGPSRTPGEPFEWDIQLGKDSKWKKYSRDGKHINVSLSGRLTHR